MIKSKADYKAYLAADRAALKVEPGWRGDLLDDVWQFQKGLRYLEYLTNCRKPYPMRILALILHNRRSVKLGFTIPINTFGPGLSIAHRGTIVVNSKARIGANCRIHVCVNIGEGAGNSPGVPKIGDNCYIGPGAKIFGGIEIADNISIGANAVVNKDFPESGVTIAGIPAKIIGKSSRE